MKTSLIAFLNKKLLRAEFLEREELIDTIEVLEDNLNAMSADWFEETGENMDWAKEVLKPKAK